MGRAYLVGCLWDGCCCVPHCTHLDFHRLSWSRGHLCCGWAHTDWDYRASSLFWRVIDHEIPVKTVALLVGSQNICPFFTLFVRFQLTDKHKANPRRRIFRNIPVKLSKNRQFSSQQTPHCTKGNETMIHFLRMNVIQTEDNNRTVIAISMS